MRGLDGNYINTQGDASTRMQVNYMAEVNRQQLKAQIEGMESLRKLREQVNEAEKEGSSTGPRVVNEDQGSDQRFSAGGSPGKEPPRTLSGLEEDASPDGDVKASKSHIDIRV